MRLNPCILKPSVSIFLKVAIITKSDLVQFDLNFFRRTMMTDPGAVPRGNATKENIQQMGFKEGQVIFKCPKCCSIKPER